MRTIDLLGELEEDEDHEADEGERLGEGDAEEHRRLHLPGGLGLAFGSLAAMLSVATMPELLGPIPHVIAFGGTAAATVAASVSVARHSSCR